MSTGSPQPDWTLEDSLQHAVLCWLASVDDAGQPNVSPKEVFVMHEGRLLIAEIASPQSLRNLRANPACCVSLIEIFRQRGHKLIGQAQILAPGDPGFDAAQGRLADIIGPAFRIRHVIAITIERVSEIRAPSYQRFPERSSAEHIRRTKARYGV